MQARPRRRPTRTILLTAGAVIIAGGALALFSATLSPEQLRADLADAVRRQTGRELTTGAVHLRLGLAPQIVLDDVALANAPGGSRPAMLTAQHVRARLALLPLLGGDAVISALTIENPDLLLERTADGTLNWQFARPASRALYTGHGASGGGGGAHHVEIRSLALEGGQASWRPAAAGQPSLTVAIDRLTVSSDDLDSPMELTFAGSAHGRPLKIHATSGSLQRLQGGPVSAVAGVWPLTVDAAVQDATLHVAGGFAHPEQGRGYQLRTKLDAPALSQLDGLWPGIALPPLSQVTATALLEDGSQGDLRASQLAIHAGASDLSAWAAGLAVKQVSLTAPGPGQIAQLSVDGTYQDQPLRASATAMQPDIVGTSAPIQISVDAQAAGATLSAHGTVPPRLNAAGLDLQISARAPDLSALSPLAGRALPPAHDAALTAELGDAGVRLRGIVTRNLTFSSSLGDVSGELTAVWSPRPDIEGTLTSHALDLDGLAPGATLDMPAVWHPSGAAPSDGVAQAMPAPAPAPDGAAPPAAQALPLAWLRGFDANLSLSIGDLAWGGRHYTDGQARLLLQGGKLALNPFRAQTQDGPLSGGISIDASSDQPPVAVTLRSAALSAAAVSSALGYPDGASGTMQVDAQLSGTGQTAPALEATLDGHLGLAMVGGQVDENLVQGLLGDALNTAGVQSTGGGTAQVRCLAVRIDFHQGLGSVRALAADTSRLALDGTGQLDLSARTADLHLRPRVRLGPTEVAAPVSLRGPFGQMRAALDPVVGGGRYGLTIGSAPAGPSACAGRLALARGGLGGPMPAAADVPPDAGLVIRKPKDLLQGLFH